MQTLINIFLHLRELLIQWLIYPLYNQEAMAPKLKKRVVGEFRVKVIFGCILSTNCLMVLSKNAYIHITF